jgi:hypothetical protein
MTEGEVVVWKTLSKEDVVCGWRERRNGKQKK